MSDKQYKVRASHCDHQTNDEEMERSWEKLAKARRIALKFNMNKPPERVEYFAGLYQDQQDQLIGRYGGQFIYLQDGQVVWNGADPSNLGSRRDLSGDEKGSALWLKYVDSEEEEGERFERYSECLRLAS